MSLPAKSVVTVPPPKLTYDEFMCALCAWREARGESDEAIRGVLWVIRNRVADKRWPSTAAGVILQPYQFSSFLAGDPNVVRFPQPKNRAEWAAWERCVALTLAPGDDPTHGAVGYESCPDDAEPRWANTPVARIGAFEFYVL